MTARKPAKGKCSFCDQTVPKNGIARHLVTCAKLAEHVAKAESGKLKPETLLHLRVQAAGNSVFWLDLEMRGSATLKTLDCYLRAIWLECCGHMSHFALGGWSGEELPMSRRIEQVLRTGLEMTHLYDYGTTSTTEVKCVGSRTGKPMTRHPIVLLARNETPEYKCIECGKVAAWLCNECLIEEQTWGTLCDEHAEDHPHENYGEPVPLLNSPRLGMCGYTGPAEPPY